jgi:hypothetical protein
MSLETLFNWGPAGNVGALITSTQENRDIKELQDAVFNRLTLFNWLSQKNKVRRGGGTSIIVPIRSSKNNTAASYSNYGVINTAPQDNETAAQYLYKQYAASISLSGKEERVQNRGKQEVLDLMKVKMEDAEMALQDKLNADLFAAAPASQDVGSLVTSIDATSTIGQINSTTYSFWQSTSTGSGSFASQGVSDMRTLWNTLGQRNAASSVPDLLLTTPTVHGYYEASLIANQRYMPDNRTGNSSFDKLMFKSSVVDMDSQCTSGVMYFLNSEALELVIDPDTDFKMTEWVKPVDQDAKVAQYLVALELVIRNRRKLGKLTSITA